MTAQQHKLLRFIHRQIQETGVCPSYQEMTGAIGITSKTAVYKMLMCLREAKFITVAPGRARSIEVIRLPGRPPEGFRAGVEASIKALDEFTAPKGSGQFGQGYIVARENIRAAIEALLIDPL